MILKFNSPVTIVQFLDIFPFWAKMKTVIMASCDDFCKKFLSQSQVHELKFYVKNLYEKFIWKMFIFLISFITFLNLNIIKAKYEKGKISVPGELRIDQLFSH